MILALPDATDTLAGLAALETLTNKAISGSSNTLSNIALLSMAAMSDGTLLGAITARLTRRRRSGKRRGRRRCNSAGGRRHDSQRPGGNPMSWAKRSSRASISASARSEFDGKCDNCRSAFHLLRAYSGAPWLATTATNRSTAPLGRRWPFLRESNLGRNIHGVFELDQ